MLSYKKVMLALASCILVASCNKNEEEMVQKQESVSFTASMKTLSRATETNFEENDQIVVYAVKDEGDETVLKSSGNYANYVKYTYTGNKFVNETSGIVRPTEFGVRYFAIYPANSVTSVPKFKFAIKTGQLYSGQYTMSDLCTAVSDATMDKEVDLVFSHRLSHVVVNLEGDALGTGNATVKLNNVNTGCDVDLNANTFTAYESRATVLCAENGTNSYKAIIVPQTIEAGSAFLTVTLNGKEYVLKASTDIRFTSGKQQVFNVTIEKDEIVSFTGNILPWGQEDERIEQVIPDDIRQKMEAYVPIYDGVNPPNIEGCYLLDPMVAIYMSDYDGDLSAFEWAGEYINFTNQNTVTNTIDMEELSTNGDAYAIGEGAIIVGEGNNFSVLFNTEGATHGIYNKTALLISGTKGKDGIKDMKYAFVMVEKGDDPEGELMEEGAFRVFQDQDGMAYATSWPIEETRAAEWIPVSKGQFDIKSRLAN
ncbi:MAG: fimbrillin family protein [Bacteroidaceae bacterium]|nr:fimbrillin family protein [Bacteroidaceae bacterium]